MDDTSPREKILDNVEQSSNKYNPVMSSLDIFLIPTSDVTE